jgi:hypothetical protein
MISSVCIHSQTPVKISACSAQHVWALIGHVTCVELARIQGASKRSLFWHVGQAKGAQLLLIEQGENIPGVKRRKNADRSWRIDKARTAPQCEAFGAQCNVRAVLQAMLFLEFSHFFTSMFFCSWKKKNDADFPCRCKLLFLKNSSIYLTGFPL